MGDNTDVPGFLVDLQNHFIGTENRKSEIENPHWFWCWWIGAGGGLCP